LGDGEARCFGEKYVLLMYPKLFAFFVFKDAASVKWYALHSMDNGSRGMIQCHCNVRGHEHSNKLTV
jgi:hypothetical protein